MSTEQVQVRISGDPSGLRRGMDDARRAVDDGANGMRNAMREVSSAISGLAVLAGITNTIREAVKAFNESQAAMMGMAGVARYTGNSFDDVANAAKELSADGLMTMTEAARGLQNLLMRGFSLEESIRLMNRFKDSAAFNRQASLEFGQAVVTATEGLKNENSVLVDNAGVTKNVSMMWKEYAAEHGKSVDQLTIAEKRLAEYNGILRETEGQLGNAVKMSNTFAGELSKAKQEAFESKAALGQALVPALTVLTRAYQAVVEAVRTWVRWIEIASVYIAAFVDTALALHRAGGIIGLLFSGDARGQIKRHFDTINQAVDEQIAEIRKKHNEPVGVDASMRAAGNGPRRTDPKAAPDKSGADKAAREAQKAARDELAYQLQMLQESLAAEERGSLARIDIARKEAELIKKHHGERSREYQSALGKIDQMHREYADEQIQREQTLLQKKQELQLIDIEMARETTQQKRRAGQISEAQEILALQDLERKKFEIEAVGLRERAKLYPEGSREREQLMNQLEIAEKRHGLNLMKINSGTTKAVARDWSSAFDSIADSLGQGVQAMNRGTLTWRNAISHVAQQVYGLYTQMFRRVVTAHLASEQAKTAGTVTASGIREGVEKGSMLKSIAMTIWGALKKIAIMAYEAAAGAYAATVTIPVVGPILAPIAAAATFLAVGAYGAAVASAAGGWDMVDRDQLAMVHKREMILPADLADRVRGITEPGIDGGGAISLTINAIDAKSVRRLFNENGPAMAGAMRKQIRNFGGR